MGYPAFCCAYRDVNGNYDYSKKMNFYSLKEAFQWLRDCSTLADKCQKCWKGYVYVGNLWFGVDISQRFVGIDTGVHLTELDFVPFYPDQKPTCCCECK